MARPLFSIVTASFNSGTKLTASAASIAAQSADWEHLILDGASTDGSGELAAALAAADPRVKTWSARDAGVYDAMNKGVERAAGRYLYFLGAGDTLRPGALAAVAARLPADDRAMVYGDVEWLGRRYDGPFTPAKLYANNICHQAIFYGRDVFDLVGRYDLRFKMCSDWDLNFRCFADRRVGKRYVPVIVADYEPGGLSTPGEWAWADSKRQLFRDYFGPVRDWQVRGPDLWGRARRYARRKLGLGTAPQ